MGEPFKLNNGTLMISTEAPGGLYNAAQLKKIAALCDTDAAVAKATEDQRLALFVKPDKANLVVKELRSVGLGVRHYQDGVHQPVSCVGALCPEFKQDALATAMDLTESLRGLNAKSSLKIGINGCSKCCVPTHTLDLSILGDESGYRVSMAGKNSQIPELASFLAEAVPSAEIGGMVGQLAKLHAESANPGESLQELVERIGSTPFVKIFSPYSQDASGASDDGFGGELDSPVAEEASPSELEAPAEELTLDSDLGADVVATDDIDLESTAMESGIDNLDDLSAEMGDVSTEVAVDVNVSADTDINLEMTDEIGMENQVGNVDLELEEVENLEMPADAELATDAEVSMESGIEDIPDLELDDLSTADVAAENIAASQIDPESINLDLDLGADNELALDEPISTEAADLSAVADLDLAAADAELADMEPLSEDQEQVLEMKLEESIEEEKISAEAEEFDDAAEDREEALRLVTDNVELAATTPVNASMIPEDDIDLGADEDLDAIAEDVNSVLQPVAASPAPVQSAGKSAAAPKPTSGRGFSGVDLRGNSVIVQFNSGVSIDIDTTQVSDAGENFTVAGQNIRVQRIVEGLRITVDGVAINLPSKLAA